jgi:hypothetical protein
LAARNDRQGASMKSIIAASLAASAAVLLPLSAAADYPGFHAAITKQINPVDLRDDSIVELGTLIPKGYELKFRSLKTPTGVVFKSVRSPAAGCTASDSKCRQYFTMSIDAASSGKCTLNGDYVASFDVACTDPKDTACKPGTHDVAFSLTSENFCSEKTVDASKLWQQVKGMFANDVGAGGSDTMWILDARKNVPGGFEVVTLGLNSSAGMRRNGGAVRIDADGNSNGFVANDKGEMFRFNAGVWNRLPGTAKDIGIGANGTAWHVGNNAVPGGFGVYRWNGKGWDDMKGGAVRIDVDPQGNAWVVNDAGQVFRYTGSAWTGIPMQARDIGIGANGSVFVTGRDGSVYKWDGKGWTSRGGKGMVDITVTDKGVPIAINDAHELWIGQP